MEAKHGNGSEPLLSRPAVDQESLRERELDRTQQLRELYRVADAMILTKVYQVAPWKAVLVKGARLDKYTFWLKFFFHISLIVLLSSMLACDNYQWVSYQRAATSLSCRYFYPKDACDIDDCLAPLSSITPSLSSFQCDLYQVRRSVDLPTPCLP